MDKKIDLILLCLPPDEAEGDKKKKDKKKKKGEKEEKEKDKKKGPSKATVKAMQEALAKMKEVRQLDSGYAVPWDVLPCLMRSCGVCRRRSAPRGRRRSGRGGWRSWKRSVWSRLEPLRSPVPHVSASAPDANLFTFQERLELERREKKKQKEKERKERLKKEGKLLTKAQREARARAEATLKVLQAQGEDQEPGTVYLLLLPLFCFCGGRRRLMAVYAPRCGSAIQRLHAKEETSVWVQVEEEAQCHNSRRSCPLFFLLHLQ